MEMGPAFSEPVNSYVSLLCLLKVCSELARQKVTLPTGCWRCCWGSLASDLHAQLSISIPTQKKKKISDQVVLIFSLAVSHSDTL